MGIFALRDATTPAIPRQGGSCRPTAACGTAAALRGSGGGPCLGVGALSRRARSSGRELARDGCSLDEALDGAAATYRAGARPRAGVRRRLRRSPSRWSEATLGYLHQLSCEDPLTGSPACAHLRGRLSELYRGAQPRRRPRPDRTRWWCVELRRPGGELRDDHRLARSLRLAQLGDTARTVFAGSETIGGVGPRPGRRHRPARRAARPAGRGCCAGCSPPPTPRPGSGSRGCRGSDAAAAALLDELARA